MTLATWDVQMVPLAVIVPYINNPRKNDKAVDAVVKSIQEFGWRVPIVCDENMLIIAGHTRYKAALKLALTHVPVHIARGLTPEQVRAYRIADNKSSENSEWDYELLFQEISELKSTDYDLTMTGFDDKELSRILAPSGGSAKQDETPAPPAEPISQRGDIWCCGKHRIMCGDATNAEDVKKLLDGKVPHICCTDPPYGNSYDPQWREQLDGIERSTGEVTNDHVVDWTEAYKLFPGDVIYVWHGDSGGVSIDVGQNLRTSGFEIRTRIVWRKEQIVMGRGSYKFQHESAFYAVRKGKKSKWCGDNSQSTVWDIPKLHPNRENGRETEHSAEKPVECMARPLRNHGDVNDAVYDPFSGAFTTMIAAHQLGRASFNMEISPRWCDVGVERYSRLIGSSEGIFLLRGDERTSYQEIGCK